MIEVDAGVEDRHVPTDWLVRVAALAASMRRTPVGTELARGERRERERLTARSGDTKATSGSLPSPGHGRCERRAAKPLSALRNVCLVLKPSRRARVLVSATGLRTELL